MATSNSRYDALRKQSRTLESLVESKLSAYARLASTVTRSADLEAGSSSTDRLRDAENEVEGLLDKLRETHEEMAAQLNDATSPPSQSMLHAVQRHRDVLQDYTRDFARTKSNVQAALDKANLLGDVRNDINSYKAAHSSVTDALLEERGRIDSSHRMIDETLDQAYETRAEFGRQRTSLAGINTRMQGVLSTLPGINSLIGMIQSRRRRDSIIIGCLIGLCLVALMSYMTR
ncbi:hypothetical protein FS837_011913 [Tulasnella sp. UAMH 9824]|nr:hypothetical protein FS837_011913 [Tulasnella sp. UAMH 9824]